MFEEVSFIELTVSTFLGFLSAIVVGYAVERIKDSRNANDAFKGISTELKAVSNSIKGLNDGSYILDPIETPIWDSLVYGGNVPRLRLRKDIFLAYRYIDRLNNWENMRTEAFFRTGEANLMLDKEVEKSRDSVLKMIDLAITHLENTIR